MFGDMGKMMQQLKEMKANMQEAQKELQAMTLEGSAHHNKIKITMNGEMDIQSVTIDPSLRQEETSVIEKAVLSAVKDVISKAKKTASSKLGKLTGGLNLPGM